MARWPGRHWGSVVVATLVALPLVAIAVPMATPQEPRTVIEDERGSVRDIYLLIGQSNMAGRAPIEDADREVLDQVYLWDQQSAWTPASNDPYGFNRYSTVEEASSPKTGLSPAYTFAKRLSGETGRSIGLVVNARGATSVNQWKKDGYTGDYPLYAEAVQRTRAALEASPNAMVRGVIWHQGESDNEPGVDEYYVQTLARIVSDLRRDLDAQQAAFVLGEVGTWQGRGHHVNPQIRQVPEAVEHAAWVSSADLATHEATTDVWGPHFDAASQRELGRRYAEAILELTQESPWSSL